MSMSSSSSTTSSSSTCASSGSTMTGRSRSPHPLTPHAKARANSSGAVEKHSQPYTFLTSSCDRCQSKTGENVTRFDVPLIALPRAFNALLGFAIVVRAHTSQDAVWWPWEHIVLFILCWIQLFWNLFHSLGSILGYAWWPSSKRAVGLPPITITVGSRTICSFGGPDEDEAEKRRRYKRIQFSIIDVVLAIPTLAFLVYSAHIMYPWWGSRYVGLRPPTIGLIASLVSFELVTAFFQLFQFFEAKVIGVQLTMQDIYEKDHPGGRLQL
ncbi:hypothetical protein F5Y16DRAFT_384672 [Xylariaceae sp. FL0255]|nr:hypothetical protein F5Y16DRAFT_384672 [Xylariaceae sp. FL0255]